MNQIIAAVRAALSAITSFVWVTCKLTGRLIMKCVPDIGARPPAPTPVQRSVQRPASASVSELRPQAEPTPASQAVKRLAQKMAAGTVKIEDMHDVGADVVRWMSSLDHQQLCRLICVEDLNAYMNRKVDVRGLPRYLQPIERPTERRTADPEMAYVPVAAPAI